MEITLCVPQYKDMELITHVNGSIYISCRPFEQHSETRPIGGVALGAVCYLLTGTSALAGLNDGVDSSDIEAKVRDRKVL